MRREMRQSMNHPKALRHRLDVTVKSPPPIAADQNSAALKAQPQFLLPIENKTPG